MEAFGVVPDDRRGDVRGLWIGAEKWYTYRMKTYDIIEHDGHPALRLRGATRAGMISGAIEGIYDISQPQVKDGDALPEEREFVVQGEDFTELFHRLLNEVLILGKVHKEAYEGIRLSLITETDARGALLSRPVKSMKRPFAAAALVGGAVAKNEHGQWDVTVEFAG